jgi:hypothetical protein
MGVSEFDAFRDQLLRLLDLADERDLTDVARDRLHQAIKLRHGDWLGQVVGTPAEDLGRRLVAQLAEADNELPPAQVEELEALVLARLPQFDEHWKRPDP